ncbi:MAG: hypothetical protein ACI8RD_007781 [Bacillariaceae sp.]|jgi:hypothetical protein
MYFHASYHYYGSTGPFGPSKVILKSRYKETQFSYFFKSFVEDYWHVAN